MEMPGFLLGGQRLPAFESIPAEQVRQLMADPIDTRLAMGNIGTLVFSQAAGHWLKVEGNQVRIHGEVDHGSEDREAMILDISLPSLFERIRHNFPGRFGQAELMAEVGAVAVSPAFASQIQDEPVKLAKKYLRV